MISVATNWIFSLANVGVWWRCWTELPWRDVCAWALQDFWWDPWWVKSSHFKWCIMYTDEMFAIPWQAYYTEAIWFILPTVNAADNKQRDNSMSCIKVNIDVWVTFDIARPIKLPQCRFICNLSDCSSHRSTRWKCVFFFSLFSENNTISVWNNGKGIPVVQHKVEKVYVPALIFGQLLTSSNYDDDEKKVTGENDF